MEKITIVDCDDWVGLYVGGELKLQGHSLSTRDVVEVITGERPEYYEYLDGLPKGYLPSDLGALEGGLK